MSDSIQVNALICLIWAGVILWTLSKKEMISEINCDIYIYFFGKIT